MNWSLLLVVCCAVIQFVAAGEKKLQIGVKKRVSPEDCKIKSRKGDKLSMHYTVGFLDLAVALVFPHHTLHYVHVYESLHNSGHIREQW